MVGLGLFPGELASGGFRSSEAFSVSANGSVIVGNAYVWDIRDYRAFIWDNVNGMRSLTTVLSSVYGLDLSGWILTQATGISADGLTIVGTGGFFGAPSAWIAVIPEPSTALLLGIGTAWIASSRRTAISSAPGARPARRRP